MEMQALIDPFNRLVSDACPPDVVRAIEAGGDPGPAWDLFEQSGFLDALVPEHAGGAGLELADAAPLLALLGAHAVPLPVGDTMIARALIVLADRVPPPGPIVLAAGAGPTPFAGVAQHALVVAGCSIAQVSVDAVVPVDAHLTGRLVAGATVATFSAGRDSLRPISAVLRALLIAGAVARVLGMTVDYANQRSQFGKPIGKLQAVQQQLAVLAEQSVAARIAAQIGCRNGLAPSSIDAAIAKHGASVAAVEATAIAHAVHGAIGISEEFDLQLLTRALHCWRLADGAESYWAAILGFGRAASECGSIDLLR